MRTEKFLRIFLCAAALPIAACNTSPPQQGTKPVTRIEMPPVAAARVDFGTPPAQDPPTEIMVAEESDPAPTDLVKKARAAIDDGDLDGAYKLAKQAAVDTPERSAAWNTLGRVQLKRGEHEAALDSFDQAVETNPNSAWARNNLGLALIYAERYDEAVDELEEATDILPTCGLMWNNLGVAYEHVDRVEEARTAYRQAMNLEHKSAAKNYVRLEGVKSLRHTAQVEPTLTDESDTGL